MEKRLLLAVVLMTAAIVLTNVIFPPPEPVAVVEPVATEVTPAASTTPGSVLPISPIAAAPAGIDTVTVHSDSLYDFKFSSRGAAVIGAELFAYPSYTTEGERVQLIPANSPGLFVPRLLIGNDTIDLRAAPFAASAQDIEVDAPDTPLEFTYADSTGFGIRIRYEFDPDSYLVDVSGRVDGLGGRSATLLTDLGPGLGMHEHPDHHSENEFAVVTRTADGIERLKFKNIAEDTPLGSALTWVGIKDKYFLAAMVASEQAPMSGALAAHAPDGMRQVGEKQIVLPQAMITTALPIAPDGSFSYSAYLGPQDYTRLQAIGSDLQEVTPYGYRWLEPVIRPFAAAILWVLNTLHDTLGIAYGWVLAIFGVMMRIVLWPLNARAMRAQMKNMAVQPLMQEIKEKYKNDPQKMQEATLGLYKEHGFNPLGGCLPMLVPFPVLITLFFVFQNTIAFRGAEFLWLPDLSLRDPLYILPLILMVSMFGLQWVSTHLSGIEQNPQMKMMMYMMPIMMGVLFFMLPAGLNLYYAVTQIASVPQQVLIAKERKQAQEALKLNGGPKLSATPVGKRRSPKSKR